MILQYDKPSYRIKDKKLRKEFKEAIRDAAFDGPGGLVWNGGKGHIAKIEKKFRKSKDKKLMNMIRITTMKKHRMNFTYRVFIEGWTGRSEV